MSWPGAFALVGGIGGPCAALAFIAWAVLKYGKRDES